MSQFIIFTVDNFINKKEYQRISNLEENSDIYLSLRNMYFKDVKLEKIYTILNFDDICANAQLSFINEKFEESQLYGILGELKKGKIIFWYGLDYGNLPEIKCFEELMIDIKRDLPTTSGELYFYYNPSNLE